YEQIMDVTDTGIMGYIEIPKINVYMPIYHNVDEGTLQIAVGHIPGSSVPVGGESTHSLLSGHTGLPSAKLFTNIDQLKVGDMFFIHVFDEVLAYRVDQINTVLPDEVEKLDIEEGKDYVTLITCTPYGVNSHRLLIRGERTQYSKPTKNIEEVINHTWLKFVAIIAAGVGLILIIILVYLIKRRKRRKLNEK
ncbi:MAG: class C sortase, partial [[Eubacterium] sulci]|nr:class C sortase [[Eubacterium] sulci]